MSEIFTKIGGYIASGDPLVYADSATMTGDGTVASPFGVNKMDMFVQAPLFTGTSGEGDNTSAYIGWNNEAVLWEGTTTTGCTLSEYATNFDKVQVTYYSTEGGTARPFITEFPATALSWNFVAEFVGYNDYLIHDVACYSSNDCLNYAYERGSHGWYDIAQVRAGGNAGTIVGLTKVVGINRKA
jgi:hypothetical protein